MKMHFIVAGIATGLTLASTTASASDGTVNFTGEIIDEACVVDIGTDATMTVDLGTSPNLHSKPPGMKRRKPSFL